MVTSYTHRQVIIKFSLTLEYPKKYTNAHSRIDNTNEGVLLKANTLNSSQFLHFYYNKETTDSGDGIILHVDLSEGQLRLTYDNDSNGTVVPGTLNEGIGLLNFSLNSSQLVNKMVMLAWEQYSHENHKKMVDVWSLDNVAVTLHHNHCMRTVFSDDFEAQQ